MTRIPRRLADLQAQQVEVGRIRLGTSTQKTSRAGKEYNEPVKLDRFRLTSRSHQLIDQAAQVYGGTPEPWLPQTGGAEQRQVIIEARSIRVVVPPDPVSQYYELWVGGRCQRRCDGQQELISGNACVCGPDPAERKCKPTTRLSLMLADLPGIGIWRLETHGYYAAVELPAVADILSSAGGNVPARLEMEERQANITDPRGKETTARFMVPVLHVEATPAEIIATWSSTAPQIGGEVPVALPATAPVVAIEAAPQVAAVNGSAVATATGGHGMDSSQYASAWSTIMGAGTLAELNNIAARIKTAGFSPGATAKLRTAWGNRKQVLEYQAANDLGADPDPDGPDVSEPVEPESPPPAEPVDRNAEWMAIQLTAGMQNLTTSQLKKLFEDWATVPGVLDSGASVSEVSQADGALLRQFHVWLKERKTDASR